MIRFLNQTYSTGIGSRLVPRQFAMFCSSVKPSAGLDEDTLKKQLISEITKKLQGMWCISISLFKFIL